ncbi:MAG: hypothetical protein ACK5L3_07960 [Oscillospiraceae bacterium]
MEGEKRPRGLVILVGCLAAALAVVLGLNLFLLWGRGAAVASSGGGAAAAASQGGGQSAGAAAQAQALWELPAWAKGQGFVMELPKGPYTPVGQGTFAKLFTNDTRSITWALPSAEEGVVMQCFFYEDGGFTIGEGVMESDAGRFYTGEYTYLGDGLFSASVYTYEYVDDSVPPSDYVDLTVLVEWPPEGFDCAVITLVSYEAKDAGSKFAGIFGETVGRQLPFTRF